MWFISQVVFFTSPAGGSVVRWEEQRARSLNTGLCHRFEFGHGLPLSWDLSFLIL